MQITVSYLQVVAMALAVNNNWTETLVGVFQAAGDLFPIDLWLKKRVCCRVHRRDGFRGGDPLG